MTLISPLAALAYLSSLVCLLVFPLLASSAHQRRQSGVVQLHLLDAATELS